jgi:hypothetical protein
MFNWIAKEEGADAADPEKAGAMAPEPMAPPAEAGRWHRADGTGADGAAGGSRPIAPEPMAPPAEAGRWHRADGTGADGTRADGTRADGAGARRRRPEADSYDICPQFTDFPSFGLKVFCAVPIGRAQTR